MCPEGVCDNAKPAKEKLRLGDMQTELMTHCMFEIREPHICFETITLGTDRTSTNEFISIDSVNPKDIASIAAHMVTHLVSFGITN